MPRTPSSRHGRSRTRHSERTAELVHLFEQDGRLLVTLKGELDLLAAPDVEPQVVQRMRAGHIMGVEVDLRELTFMDASGLRCLLAIRNAAARHRVTLTVTEGPPQVRRLFALTGTADLFQWVH
jgi:anti-anti-sigma factor